LQNKKNGYSITQPVLKQKRAETATDNLTASKYRVNQLIERSARAAQLGAFGSQNTI